MLTRFQKAVLIVAGCLIALRLFMPVPLCVTGYAQYQRPASCETLGARLAGKPDITTTMLQILGIATLVGVVFLATRREG